MRPRTPVHIVGADQGDLIVDHDDLRVDVDRRTPLVLEVVDTDAVATGVPHQVEGAPLPQPMRRPADRPISIGETWDDHDHAELGASAEGLRERLSNLTRPEVLVLDVEQRSRAPERLLIEASDGALPPRRERIPGSACGICPQHLDRLRPPPSRLGDRREGFRHRVAACVACTRIRPDNELLCSISMQLVRLQRSRKVSKSFAAAGSWTSCLHVDCSGAR